MDLLLILTSNKVSAANLSPGEKTIEFESCEYGNATNTCTKQEKNISYKNVYENPSIDESIHEIGYTFSGNDVFSVFSPDKNEFTGSGFTYSKIVKKGDSFSTEVKFSPSKEVLDNCLKSKNDYCEYKTYIAVQVKYCNINVDPKDCYWHGGSELNLKAKVNIIRPTPSPTPSPTPFATPSETPSPTPFATPTPIQESGVSSTNTGTPASTPTPSPTSNQVGSTGSTTTQADNSGTPENTSDGSNDSNDSGDNSGSDDTNGSNDTDSNIFENSDEYNQMIENQQNTNTQETNHVKKVFTSIPNVFGAKTKIDTKEEGKKSVTNQVSGDVITEAEKQGRFAKFGLAVFMIFMVIAATAVVYYFELDKAKKIYKDLFK